MAKDISKLSHNALAKEIERLSSVVDKASAPIWNAALHGNERWSDIVARLGESDPRVARYRAALAPLSRLSTTPIGKHAAGAAR